MFKPKTERQLAKMVFVFGSNEAGVHGAGAARVAHNIRKMPFGKSYGHYGECFAIPTKDEFIKESLPLRNIQAYVSGFQAYAIGKRKVDFQVTMIGCGLAGLLSEDIAPMFRGSPGNCYFDTEWKMYLGNTYNYWGTY